MNATSGNRTLSNTSVSHEKVTLKLTPLATSHNSIIRISAKGTPTSTSQGHNSSLNNRITRHQYSNQSVAPKTIIVSPSTTLSKDFNNNYKRLIRSQITTTNKNWQVQCGVLKQTLDHYKNKIVELQKNNSPRKQPKVIDLQSDIYKQRLQQTQNRMNQQNAYLRQCISILNDQLKQTKNTIPSLQNTIAKLQDINKTINEQLKQKSFVTKEQHQLLLQQMNDQKHQKQTLKHKLMQLNNFIQQIQKQNHQINKLIQEEKKINLNLEEIISQQKKKNGEILKSCFSLQQQVSYHKQHINELQNAVTKLRQDNQKVNNKVNQLPKKNRFLSRSVSVINNSSEFEHAKLTTSTVAKSLNKSLNNSEQLRKSYSSAIIPQAFPLQQFNFALYQQKAEQFRILKTYSSLQNGNLHDTLSSLFDLGQYFKDAINYLVKDKTRLQSNIEKFKRLVDISYQNPQSQARSQEFVTDLIEKCNLYQSSLFQKKNTIKSLQQELENIKRQMKSVSQPQKQKYKYLDRQDELEKQKIIINKLQKQVDQLNMKLIHPTNSTKKNVEKPLNNPSTSLTTLGKMKTFKNFSGTSLKKQHSKLKNVSGEQILKTMETKLKFYQGEVVPELEAKISQYKGVIDSFERESFNNNNHMQQSVQQSKVVSIVSRIPVNPRRRRNINSMSFDDFQDNPLKQSYVTRPETTDSSLSKQKKKRLDELTRGVSTNVLAAITLRLCEISQRMVNNQNYSLILPDSVYIINYSDQYVGSLKIKILQTPKSRQSDIKRYWAPENINGNPLGQLSLVWNIGILLDQTIHGKLFFTNQKQILDMETYYKYMQQDNPFFKALLPQMIQKDRNKRITLKQIQDRILQQQQTLFN